jgi:hypothetical protein
VDGKVVQVDWKKKTGGHQEISEIRKTDAHQGKESTNKNLMCLRKSVDK